MGTLSIDRQVPWAEVRRHCIEEIERLQRSLEVIQPEATTNQLRGEIRALRRVVKLGEPAAPPDPSKKIQPDTPDTFV